MSKIDICREYSVRFPNTPDRQLARVIFKEKGHLWPNLDACYQCVRAAHGKHGVKKRAETKPTSFKALQTAPFKWKMPESKSEPWKVFEPGTERNLIISDLHIPFHDSEALELALESGDQWLRKGTNKDAVIINGDLGDFFSISRFEKNPAKSKLVDEIRAMREFLGYLRQRFPGVKIIYKFGNHDEWWDKHIFRKSPELIGLPSMDLRRVLVCDLSKNVTPDPDEDEKELDEAFSQSIEGIDFVQNQRIIMLGAMPLMHGHELGRGFAPPVNPARGAFLKALSHVMVGHHHQWSSHQARTLTGKVISTYSTGCLCFLTPEFARVNQWAHGFARVEVTRGHEFEVQNYKIINGKTYQ